MSKLSDFIINLASLEKNKKEHRDISYAYFLALKKLLNDISLWLKDAIDKKIATYKIKIRQIHPPKEFNIKDKYEVIDIEITINKKIVISLKANELYKNDNYTGSMLISSSLNKKTSLLVYKKDENDWFIEKNYQTLEKLNEENFTELLNELLIK